MIEWIEQHREILGWLAGGVATAAGGAWVVARYLLERNQHAATGSPDGFQPAYAPPAYSPPDQTSGTAVSTGTGISATGGVKVGGNVIIQHNRLPKGAILLAVLGLLLLGYTALNSGSHINVKNGSAVGGNVNNSVINVNPSK